MVTMESLYRKLPSLFRIVPSLIPTTSPSPKVEVPKCTPGPTLRGVLPPGKYDRIYRQSVCCIGCYETSDAAFLPNYFGPFVRCCADAQESIHELELQKISLLQENTNITDQQRLLMIECRHQEQDLNLSRKAVVGTVNQSTA